MGPIGVQFTRHLPITAQLAVETQTGSGFTDLNPSVPDHLVEKILKCLDGGYTDLTAPPAGKEVVLHCA